MKDAAYYDRVFEQLEQRFSRASVLLKHERKTIDTPLDVLKPEKPRNPVSGSTIASGDVLSDLLTARRKPNATPTVEGKVLAAKMNQVIRQRKALQPKPRRDRRAKCHPDNCPKHDPCPNGSDANGNPRWVCKICRKTATNPEFRKADYGAIAKAASLSRWRNKAA